MSPKSRLLVITQNVPLPFAQLEHFRDHNFTSQLMRDEQITVQSFDEGEESKLLMLRPQGHPLQRHAVAVGLTINASVLSEITASIVESPEDGEESKAET